MNMSLEEIERYRDGEREMEKERWREKERVRKMRGKTRETDKLSICLMKHGEQLYLK